MATWHPEGAQITVTSDEGRREYIVVYRDDPPDRKETVEFFTKHGDTLFPSMATPPEVENMPIEEANAYLRQHPIEKQWASLTISDEHPIQDDDLARLRHLPEIRHVRI